MARCDDCMKNPVHPDKKCCFNCARVGTDCEVWHLCGEDCPGWDSKVVTNADKIRAMSDEWLANYLIQFTDLDCRIGFCQNLPKCDALLETEDGIPLSMCKKCLLDWLQQPAEETK